MKAKVFKVPNSIIVNSDNLNPSTIGIAIIFFAYMNKHRKFSSSLKHIASMSSRCEDTVRQAVGELEHAGHLKRIHNYVFSPMHNRTVYSKSTYQVVTSVENDYTLIPYAWLGLQLTPCHLQVLLCCRMFMLKEKGRAFPSIRKVVARIGVAKSTVCKAIAHIVALGILLVEHCKKENGAYTSNSYHMITHALTADIQLLTETYVLNLLADSNRRAQDCAAPLLTNCILPHSLLCHKQWVWSDFSVTT